MWALNGGVCSCSYARINDTHEMNMNLILHVFLDTKQYNFGSWLFTDICWTSSTSIHNSVSQTLLLADQFWL